MARHNVGDKVRLWKPGHAELGANATVLSVDTIQEYYGGPEVLGPFELSRGPNAYRLNVPGWCRMSLPDAMVVSEAEYQQARADAPYPAVWPE
jgi:hypothetical protein